MTAEAQSEYKLRFAALLQRIAKRDRLTYAIHVATEVVGKTEAARFPTHLVQIAADWPHDPLVVAEIERLDAIPMSKEEWLQRIKDVADDKHTEQKDCIAALRLYGEGGGWLARGTPPKEQGSPAEWTEKTLEMAKAAGR
jgi:hypothetical protein